MRNQKDNKLLNGVFALILIVYALIASGINFSRNPSYYVADMYSDMLYAREVSRTGTIFPDNWVFGNQFYAVATPVLAAFFCRLTEDPYLPMAIATTLMGLGVLWSFDWMIRPFLPERTERLGASALFMTLHLLCGDAYYHTLGWQLLFTMCSYYGCYAISLFLAFGCYIRRNDGWNRKDAAALAVSCLLSFGTGIQSLRQTAIMVCPLVAAEGLCFLWRLWRKERPFGKSTLVAAAHMAANFLGVVTVRILDPNQMTIYGAINVLSVDAMLRKLPPAVDRLLSVTCVNGNDLRCLLLFAFGVLLILAIRDGIRKKDKAAVCCIFLFLISAAAIFVVDVCTSMLVRNIYYFMLYPLVAILGAMWLRRQRRFGSLAFAAVLTVAAVVGCATGLNVSQRERQDPEKYRDVVNYLEQEGINTIYSAWNQGEQIGLTSNFEIKVGFWNERFEYIPYLCDPTVFDAAASDCAYVFLDQQYAQAVEEDARNAGVDFELVKSFEHCEAYVYTSEHTVRELYDLVIGQ